MLSIIVVSPIIFNFFASAYQYITTYTYLTSSCSPLLYVSASVSSYNLCYQDISNSNKYYRYLDQSNSAYYVASYASQNACLSGSVPTDVSTQYNYNQCQSSGSVWIMSIPSLTLPTFSAAGSTTA